MPPVARLSLGPLSDTRLRLRYSPKAYGSCPGLADTGKPVLVVSRVASDGDAAWLDKLSDRYHICAYDVDGSTNGDPTQLRVPANRGHEAMAYLTFLIDNYEHIPAEGAVFVHGSRWAWHNDSPDYDNAELLAALNTPSALAQSGYHNLRCDWSASTCPADSQPQGSFETSLTAKLEPFNARVVSDAAMPRALASIFSGASQASESLLGRGDAVKSQCCAQFIVARDNIWQHSQAEYVALRQWLLDDGLESAPRDDRISGRILSYLWHILFLPQQGYSPRASAGVHDTVDLDRLNSLACPTAAECYCRLYGRCELRGCSEGSCLGQYTLPRDYKLPEDWARTHSGVVKGKENGDSEHEGLKKNRRDEMGDLRS
ncbi:hypothetical protein Q7P37_001783 [Cladosporium fusiforme]